ncbi:MAG: sugar phosphate isomerase/epimerase [Acidobacteriaceae bacterium]|nr:sugar phosphate isomerase/epimerase [Acidobacteriaceae bacterium]
MSYSRRDFGKVLMTALPAGMALGRINSTVDGVRLGVCTYSFRELPRVNGDALGPVIQALKECNAGICELFSPQIEPENVMLTKLLHELTTPGPDGKLPSMQEAGAKYRAAMHSPEAKKYREELRQWRLTTPMDHFKAVRKQFDEAGVDIYAYTLNFSSDFTDEELDKCFQQAKALDVRAIASSTQASMLPRLKPLAEKYKIYVAVHGHSDTKHPDEFSSPETFQKALDMSNWFRVNLDIGHFSAAGFDPVAYITEHHDRITHLHIKDRKKNDGPNAPFGEGDTPIKAVLLLLKEKKYPIPALVEYEYKGAGSPVEEVNKCLAYMKSALQGA